MKKNRKITLKKKHKLPPPKKIKISNKYTKKNQSGIVKSKKIKKKIKNPILNMVVTLLFITKDISFHKKVLDNLISSIKHGKLYILLSR